MSAVAENSSGTTDVKTQAIIAGIVGNVLEWYDFAIYAFLVPIISQIFFPTTSPANAVLFSLAVFGSGFVMRPAGAIVFGIWADRFGRRSALSAVMIVMGLATFGIGLIPTYGSIGILAPILLVCLRLLQGLASGGEWGGSASFMVEYAPLAKRGFYGSWHVAGLALGILLGSLFVSALTAAVGTPAISAWAWRLPFLFGVVVALVGLFIRLKLPETPHYAEAEAKGEIDQTPLRSVFRNDLGTVLLAFSITTFQAITSWLLLTYMVTYLTTVAGLPFQTALMINTVGLVVLIAAILASGALSDSFGRKPLMIASCILIFIAAIPGFMGILSGSTAIIVLSYCALLVSFSLYAGAMGAAMVELFPTSVRVTGLSIAYNSAHVIFGGFAPLIAQSLVNITGNSLAPTGYMMAGAVVSLLALMKARETAFTPLR
jgi:MHS family proline/betaine transporter-like MFS transporter